MPNTVTASPSQAASDQGAAFGLMETRASTAEPRDFWQLMKPRVMSLVVFTAFIGLVAAPGTMHPFLALASILCIALGAGASGALNMWYDADIDAEMTRTKRRPVPQGKITATGALAFGSSMSVLAVVGLYFAANIVAAGLLAMTIAFYLFVYTMWLKRSTPQNIVIGGAAGAFPPMVGWAAASGDVTLNSLALFLIIFLWTPPHFWALALYKTMDYGRVNIPMMPNVKGAKSTRAQMLAYAVLLAAVCFVPVATGLAGSVYGFVAVILNAGFLALTFKVWRSRAGETADPADEESLYAVRSGDKVARNLFAFSILYLFALFGALGADIALQSFSAIG